MIQKQIQQTFGANVKACRKINGLTQDQFSKVLGVKRSRVGSWEEGRGLPTTEFIIKISDFFQKDIRTMLTQIIPNGSVM